MRPADPIAIIAVRQEVDPLLERVALLSSEPAGPYALWKARWAKRDLLIAACGVGKVNAALAAQSLVERFHPGAILSCGSAGSLCRDVAFGELVIASGAMQHDAGLHFGQQFVHMGTQVQDCGRTRTQRIFHADPTLLTAAQRAAPSVLEGGQPLRVHVGLVATGDQALFSAERRAALRQSCAALAVDMESAAIAQVAQANAVPWLALRGISDAADEQAGMDFSPLIDYVEDGSGAVGWARCQQRRLRFVLAHPAALGKLKELRAGIRLAAGRAARLTLAAIEQL